MVYRGFPGVMEFCVVELDLFLVNVFLVEKTEFLVVGDTVLVDLNFCLATGWSSSLQGLGQF